MIKKMIASCVMLISATGAFATAEQAVYAEVGGAGLLYSINYEYMFSDNFGARAGYGFSSTHGKNGAIRTKTHFHAIPLMANYLIGEGCNRFEVGLGGTILQNKERVTKLDYLGTATLHKHTNLIGTGVLGYRFMPETEGVIFRAGFTPVYISGDFIPWLGVSVGYAF